MAASFDVSTLNWVKAEIDDTLRQARVALETYVEEPEDETQIRFCVNYLHQVTGTLRMVELHGAEQVATEIEQLAIALQNGEVKDQEASCEVLMGAILQLPDYLEALQGGQPDNPMIMLPVINALRRMHEQPALSEEDFFNPNLSVMPPAGAEKAAGKMELTELARKARPHYQAALLNLLKGKAPATSLRTLSAILDKLQAVATKLPLRQYLWIAGGLSEALADQGLTLEAKLKRLLSRAEQIIKAVGQGGEEALAADALRELSRDMLFQLAHAESSGERVQALKTAFRLNEILPSPEAVKESRRALGGVNADLKKTLSSNILEELSGIKDIVDLLGRAQEPAMDKLESMSESLVRLSETLGMMGLERLRALIQEQIELLQRVQSGQVKADEDSLMAVASAVLAVESALTSWGDIAPVEQADEVDEQISAGEGAIGAEAEHQRIVRQVMKESKADLVWVKDAIDNFLANMEDATALWEVPQRLHGIIGGLNMLSYKRVARVLEAAARYINEDLAPAKMRPSDELLDALADVLTSVEYYFEAFIEGRVHPAAALAVAEQALVKLGHPVESLAEAPAAEEVAAVEEVPAEAGVAEEAAAEEVPTGEMPAEEAVAEEAAPIEAAVAEEVPAEEAPVEAPVAEEAAAAPAGEKAAPVEEIDEEILEIFIEEATEELERIDELLPRWQADPADTEALTELRRSFHTLKGSGRLVGAMVIGEFAWAFENMLNRVMDKTVPTSAAMFDLLSQAHEALPQLIEQFKSGAEPAVDVETLQAAADAFSKPGGSAELEVAAAPPAEEAEAEPEAAAEEAAEEAAPAIDPVLLDIYSKETDLHLESIEQFLEKCRGVEHCEPNDELARALHTLQGSSRMAGITPVAELSGLLEKYIKLLMTANVPLDAQVLVELEGCRDFTRAMLAHLVDSSQPAPVHDELLARIKDLYEHAQAELEHPPAGEEAAAGEETPPEEIEEITLEAPLPEIAVEELAEGAEEYDEELLEIFLEEGVEILDESEETLQAWVDNPADTSLVEALQRQLHTLKGSARMANVREIGDLAHSLETTIEKVQDGRLTRSKAMLDLLQLAHDRLVEQLEQVRNHEPLSSGDDLIAQAETLGKAPAVEEPEEVEEAPTEAPAAEEIEAAPAPEEEVAAPEETAPEEAAVPEEEAAPPVEEVSGPHAELIYAARERLEAIDRDLAAWRRELGEWQGMAALQQKVSQLHAAAEDAGIEEIAALSASLMTLLDRVEDGHLPVSEESFSLLQHSFSRIDTMLEQLQREEELAGGADLIASIDEMMTARSRQLEAEEAAAKKEEEAEEARREARREDQRKGSRMQHEMVRVRADLLDSLVNFAGEVSIYSSRVGQQMGAFNFNLEELDQTVERLSEQLRQFDIDTEAQIQSRYEEASQYEDFDPLEFDRFTHMQQLSRSMMESLSDLVSIEEMLRILIRESETLLLQQSRVNTELQEGLMHTRMVPLVENAPRLRRVVRQTCAELDKQAELRFQGAEVEMDRNVVERMMAPLEHMLRNAIAHGIETPKERTKAGKPESGTIVIALAREGSEVVIRVKDDGGGINLDAVRQRAIDRGLMNPDADLSDNEILHFILESGFSTAKSLTQIAGRGVGMDVVNSEIKQLGGVLEINSEPKQGTLFTVRLPLTLSVSRALLVTVGEETYAIPLLGILGIERVDQDELNQRLSDERPHYEWLGIDYDLLYLGTAIGGSGMPALEESGKRPLLFAQSGDHHVALIVDDLIGSREIVVKSLGPQLSTLHGLSGATILADGSVALILDLPVLSRLGLAQRGGKGEAVSLERAAKARPTVMVVDDSITVRKVTTRMLERNDFEAITAKDGVEAIAVLEEQIPDAMLLDIEMPRMDGFELATHIRNSERLKDIPIIMITSRSGEKHRQRAMEIGVNMYMSKPYQESALLENIRALLEADT